MKIKETIKSHFDQSPIKNRIIRGGKIETYSDLSRFLALKSLEESLEKIKNKPIKKIYTEKRCCVVCRKPIEEYCEDNKTRVVKSWVSICCKCFNSKK